MLDEPQTGHNSNVEIDFDELVQFLEDLDDKKRGVDEANGKLRSAIKQILDDQEWHKQGLAVIRSIHAKSETERADFLRTFKPLFAAMCEGVWDSEMKDMLDGMGAED